MLERIYIFAWVICIASQVLFDLSSKREVLWTQISLNSPPVLTTGHSPAGFCGGGAPEYGGTLGYKEEAPGNLELWEVSLHGGFLLSVACA